MSNHIFNFEKIFRKKENFDEEDTPLKDTFQVKVKDVNKIKDTAQKIEKYPSVAVVRYGEGMVDKMVSAFSSIEKITYTIVIALTIITIFLIINTLLIYFKMYSKTVRISTSKSQVII